MTDESLDTTKRKFFLTSVLAFIGLKLTHFGGAAQAVGKTSDASLQSVTEDIAGLKHEIKRLQAVNEIMRIMARYKVIHNQSDFHKTAELFAQHSPDTWWEKSGGTIYGYEAIKKECYKMLDQEGGAQPGSLAEHPQATPCIVVADDCKTAKGTWTSLGMEIPRRPGMKDEDMTSVWCYGKYACDFIEEDGHWKIWHMKWFRTFMNDYYTSFSDASDGKTYKPWPGNDAGGQGGAAAGRQGGAPGGGSGGMQAGAGMAAGAGVAGGPSGARGSEAPEGAAGAARGGSAQQGHYFKPYNKQLVLESIPPTPKPYKTYTDEDKFWMFEADDEPWIS